MYKLNHILNNIKINLFIEEGIKNSITEKNRDIYQATNKVLSDFHMIKLHAFPTASFRDEINPLLIG